MSGDLLPREAAEISSPSAARRAQHLVNAGVSLAILTTARSA